VSSLRPGVRWVERRPVEHANPLVVLAGCLLLEVAMFAVMTKLVGLW
jgi:hypothetical protein